MMAFGALKPAMSFNSTIDHLKHNLKGYQKSRHKSFNSTIDHLKPA